MTGSFADDGFSVLPALASEAVLREAAAALDGREGVGSRELLHEPWCAEMAQRVRADPRVAAVIPCTHVAVQCTSFEKSLARNWLVPVHQDLSIPVAARIDEPALGGWADKGGTWFVQPPAQVLEQLVALRVHIDDCGLDDGPLHVVAGSHLLGRIDDARAIELRNGRGTVACAVPRGGAMLMRPLLLHASSKSRGASRRRVLHFVFGPSVLPFGLRWASPLATPSDA